MIVDQSFEDLVRDAEQRDGTDERNTTIKMLSLNHKQIFNCVQNNDAMQNCAIQ